MVLQIVPKRRDLLVGAVIAPRAGVILVPADLRAGRGLRLMVLQIVAQRRDLLVSRVVAPRTGIVLVPADLRAGRGLRLVAHKIVPQGRDRLRLAAHFSAAHRAVNHLVIGAVLGTGRRGLVLPNRFPGRVAQSVHVSRLFVQITAGADALFPAFLGAGRRHGLRPAAPVVAEGRDDRALLCDLYGAVKVLEEQSAVDALEMHFDTGFGAGRFAAQNDAGIMRVAVLIVVFFFFPAYPAGSFPVDLPAACGLRPIAPVVIRPAPLRGGRDRHGLVPRLRRSVCVSLLVFIITDEPACKLVMARRGKSAFGQLIGRAAGKDDVLHGAGAASGFPGLKGKDHAVITAYADGVVIQHMLFHAAMGTGIAILAIEHMASFGRIGDHVFRFGMGAFLDRDMHIAAAVGSPLIPPDVGFPIDSAVIVMDAHGVIDMDISPAFAVIAPDGRSAIPTVAQRFNMPSIEIGCVEVAVIAAADAGG